MSKALIAQMLAQRESLFEVVPGKKVRIRRPAEVEVTELRRGITVEHLQRAVVGWEGFTEADLLGAGVGSTSEVPFSADLFSEWVADHAQAFAAISAEIQRLVLERFQLSEASTKN